MTPYYSEGGITIYHGDCREILPTLGRFDLTLTDPPYGIAANSGRRLHAYSDPEKSKGNIGWENIAVPTDYGDTNWDQTPLSSAEWQLIEECSDEQIIWGYNHLHDVLPKAKSTLAWDKKCKNGWVDTFSDFELAYCSRVAPDRMFRHLWMGAFRAGKRVERLHPTQKPVELMAWSIGIFPDAETVIDPYMGSGPTLEAARAAGRQAVGIEIEERYCEIAVQRLAQGVLDFSASRSTPT